MNQNKTIPFALSILAFAVSAIAATPDAGTTLQQLAPPLVAPAPVAPFDFSGPVGKNLVLPGGQKIVLASVFFAGNTAISVNVLRALIGPVENVEFDMAAMNAMTDKVTAFYRDNGYPFAWAFLPPQTIDDGVLIIETVEGNYGAVSTKGPDESLNSSTQKFLSKLKSRKVIETAPLDRAVLNLKDLPGVVVLPVIRPGQEPGTADLDVGVTNGPKITGDVGFDNGGNTFSGEYRGRVNVNINSPFMTGDQIRITALGGEESLWMGAVGYSAPLGSDGLRGNIDYSKTGYTLGKEFASLKANGTAAISSVGVSYPLLRSQKVNMTLKGAYQYKTLNDNRDAVSVVENKSSKSIPVSVLFDRWDEFGVSYGNVTFTHGNLNLDAALAKSDVKGTQGSFNKLNFDVARQQCVSDKVTGYGRVSTQWASKNLDTSESFILGGANGVRAFAPGDAAGSSGWLAQTELRYNAGAFAPYVFFDAGQANEKDLSGAGVGVRYTLGNWMADASVAWKTSGASTDNGARFLVNASYRF